MSGNATVPNIPDDAGSSTATPTGTASPPAGPSLEPDEVARKLKLLQELVEEQSRLVAKAHALAETAHAERSRTEQELEKTSQLLASVEAERALGEQARDALESILPRVQAARDRAEEGRRAAEQERQQAEAQAHQASAARQRVEADKRHTEQVVEAIQGLTGKNPLQVQLVGARKKGPDWSLIWSAVSSLAAVIACVFSFWATQEAANSVHETRQATRASVLLQLLSEYASQEMLESMKRMREFREASGGASTFRERYVALLNGQPAQDERFTLSHLNNDRRRVKGFFQKLKALAEEGIIDKRLLRIRWDRSTVIYLQDVLIPLEQANTSWMFEKGHIDETSRKRGEEFLWKREEFFRKELE
jgi:hypothetical protein